MPFDPNAMKKAFQNVGGRWAFFMAIELYKPQICKGIGTGLKDITPEQFSGMVDRREFFEIPPQVMDQLAGWSKQAKWVKVDLIGEIFAGARPDLYQVLEEKGTMGGAYLILLHHHLMDLVMHAEEQLQQPAASQEMCSVECPHCHQKWAMKKRDVPAVKECPFCHKNPNETPPDSSHG